MSRQFEWDLYINLKENIAEVLEEFLLEENLYNRPRLVIKQDRYGDYAIYVAEYSSTTNVDSEDVYSYINHGEVDYDAVDDLANQFVNLR